MSMPTRRKTAVPSATDRGLCGAADMLGIIAQENIWIGDPNGQIREVDAVMLAGRDINLVQYAASAATCCDGVNNPLTSTAPCWRSAARHWLGTGPTQRRGTRTADCNAAQPPCRPVTFVQADTSCGGAGCWRFLSKDPATGLFAVDTTLSGFRRVRDDPGPAADAAELPARESASDPFPAHDQVRQTAAGTSRADPSRVADQGQTWYTPGRLWKDCGSNPACP